MCAWKKGLHTANTSVCGGKGDRTERGGLRVYACFLTDGDNRGLVAVLQQVQPEGLDERGLAGARRPSNTHAEGRTLVRRRRGVGSGRLNGVHTAVFKDVIQQQFGLPPMGLHRRLDCANPTCTAT